MLLYIIIGLVLTMSLVIWEIYECRKKKEDVHISEHFGIFILIFIVWPLMVPSAFYFMVDEYYGWNKLLTIKFSEDKHIKGSIWNESKEEKEENKVICSEVKE